jgi:hypothetical protein
MYPFPTYSPYGLEIEAAAGDPQAALPATIAVRAHTIALDVILPNA